MLSDMSDLFISLSGTELKADQVNLYDFSGYVLQAGLSTMVKKTDDSRTEWLQKAFDKCVGNGIEDWGTSGHHYEWKGWGTLTKLLPARTDGTETSVTQVEADAAGEMPSELFSLSGVKVNASAPAPGIYVERRGASAHTRLIH